MSVAARIYFAIATIFGAAGLAVLLLVPVAHAGALSSVSLAMSDSRPGATGSTHQLGFTPAETGTTIQGVKLEYCTSAAGPCVAPANLDTTGAALAANLLDGSTANPFAGWTIDNTTNGVVEVTDSTGVSGASAQTIAVSGITNAGGAADATATIFYVKVTTYSDTGLTAQIDDGALASAVVPRVAVTARQDAMLSLTVAGVNSGTAVGSQSTTRASSPTELPFGTFKPLGTSGAGALFLAHTVTVSTNTAGGYNVTVTGGVNAMSLEDGSSHIDYVSAGTTWDDAATTGFGITATGGGAPSAFSSGANYFRADAPLTVAENASPITGQATTVAYRVQVEPTLPQGDYTGSLTYTLLSNF